MWWPSAEHPPDHPELGLADAPRRTLLQALAGCEVAAMASGHLHRFRCVRRGAVLEV